MKKYAITLGLLLAVTQLFAQDENVEMADYMRSNGKIYVVVAVAIIILLGLLLYLFTMDKRLKKLENK